MRGIITRKFLSFCFLFLSLSTFLSAQQNPVAALKKLYDDYPQEKIYLWYNKPAYVAGETIWFKAYIFSGYEVSFISSSLYVELYDSEKKLISSKLLPIISGVADGSIDLGNKLPEGVYYIRAYTQWMLNFDETFQYIHSLPVYNPASSKHLSLNTSIWKAGAFPEGGSLIEGMETKVAVRRYAGELLDTKWSGYLYEESNPTIKLKEFTALDENVGLFTFIPEAGKKYFVNVLDEQGISQQCLLPLVRNTGVAVSIEESGDSITYKLRFQNIPGNGNGYTVIGEIQHQLAYQANLRTTSAEVLMKIPTRELYNGILHLTVFDPSNHPVAERLVFVNHHKLEYDSNVVSEQMITAARRSESNLQILVDSISWISYAVSVSEATAPSSVQKENMLSTLWLTSDLSAPLQNPANYFRHPDKNKFDALDAIMVSEKWTRFNWTNIISNKYPAIDHVPLRLLSYTGKVTRGSNLKPNEEINLLLYYPDSTTSLVLTKTNSIGNIVLDELAFYDELKVFYQLNTKKSNAKFIGIDFERNNKFVPYSLPLPQTSYILTTTNKNEPAPAWVTNTVNDLKIQKEIDEKYKMLQGVVVQSKLKSPKEQLNEQLSSGRFKTTNETVFDFVNENQTAFIYSNILEWLNGRVAGLSSGSGRASIRGSAATIFVDEMRVDPGYLDALPINEIVMIKVIKGSAYALQAGVVSGGIIAIYTNRMGFRRTVQKEPSLPSNKIKGYDHVKKFFLPDYENRSNPQPDTDTRDQLLWQTLLVPATTADKVSVSYYNNDKAKQFRVVVQGFTVKGLPVYYEKIIDPAQISF